MNEATLNTLPPVPPVAGTPEALGKAGDMVKVLPAMPPMPVGATAGASVRVPLDTEYDLSDNELKMILRHCLRLPTFFHKADKTISDLSLFDSVPAMDAIYSVMRWSFSEFHEIPSRELITTQLEEIDSETRMLAEGIMVDIYSPLNDDFNSEYLYKRLFEQTQKVEIAGTLADIMSDPTDYDNVVQRLNTTQKTLAVNPMLVATDQHSYGDMSADLFGDPDGNRPTGVYQIDLATGGGPKAGEMIGYLIPSGGGKTATAFTLAYNLISKGEHVMYISAEEGWNELCPRAYALSGECSANVFKAAGGVDGIPEDIMARIKHTIPLWKDYFHFFDYSERQCTNIAEIMEPAYILGNEGKKPTTIIIDWWGSLKDSMADTLNLSDSDSRRTKTRIWLRELKIQTKNLGVATHVFHQIEAAVAHRKSPQPANTAQEDKQFQNMFNFVITYAARDKRNVLWVNPAKARRDQHKPFRMAVDLEKGIMTRAKHPDFGLDEYNDTGEDEDTDVQEDTDVRYTSAQ